MSHSLFFDSPSNSSPIKSAPPLNPEKDIGSKKRSYCTSPTGDSGLNSSPNKRVYLQRMSPNVSRKTIQFNHIPPTPVGESNKSGLETPWDVKLIPRPKLKAPISNPRSKSSLVLSRSSHSPKHKLRRTNSLISTGGSSSSSDNQQQSSTTSSDRFIPSRHNSTCGKLQTDNTNPHPNASPETHIKAQTSKIYQHHVAEACGLEMNSRILQFQPLPPERKKPVNLFSHISTANSSSKLVLNSFMNKSLRPAAASARAKKIPTAPERVLDAPGLLDDFYLNLLAWSLTNLLAIGLEDAVYVWNASTGSVGLLCELPNKTIVTSLRWSDDGSYISIGKDDGLVEIWDIETNSKLRTLNCDNHQTRIASQAWYQHILTSGSRMGNIYHSDVRVADHVVNKLKDSHLAEVCGIEYKSDGQQFSSGGNDNLVCIWDIRQCHNNTSSQPLFSKLSHRAAVKALLWCPFQLSLLATGGGSSDKTINFWNTSTGARVNTIETGSQISSLNWGYASGTGMEIVATHGFPTNNISLFNYPTLQKTGEIMGAHDSRILSGCLSPDSLTLATVAGDENLKFWSLFDLYKSNKREYERIDGDDEQSGLNPSTKRMTKMMNIR